MKQFLLKVENLNLSYKQGLSQPNAAFNLKNISFSLGHNQSVSIIGDSAAGKTSIMMALLKLIPVDSGSIIFEGQNILQFSPRKTQNYRRNVQPVFQRYAESLNPLLKIKQTLTLGLRPGLSYHKQEQRLKTLLKMVHLSFDILNQYPHQLSGGEAQRVAIARSLVTRPKIILLDEPFSALDVLNQEKLLRVLMAIQKKLKLSYIFITHKIPLVKFFSDNIYFLSKGKMTKFDNYKTFKTFLDDDFTSKPY